MHMMFYQLLYCKGRHTVSITFASRRCSLCLYSWRQLFCFFTSTTKHH